MPKTLSGFSSIPVLVCMPMDWIYIFVPVYQQYKDIVNLVWGSKKFFSVKRVNWGWGELLFPLSSDFLLVSRLCSIGKNSC